MNLDDLADVDVHLAATGMSLVKQASGAWHGENKSYTLNQLSDVTAPATTEAGKLLGTTATGAWGPVDPPAPPQSHPSWGRWAGTQAQYDAIVPHDPNTLYVITGG
jgi:hypothetical protein